jgi:hypothetical protein
MATAAARTMTICNSVRVENSFKNRVMKAPVASEYSNRTAHSRSFGEASRVRPIELYWRPLLQALTLLDQWREVSGAEAQWPNYLYFQSLPMSADPGVGGRL